MKKIIFILLALFVNTTFAQLNISLLGTRSYGNLSLANIGGYVDSLGNEYALVGYENGLDIVDVTIPTAPVLRYTITGPTSSWREVKTYRKYAYVTTEAGTTGLQIINLTNLPGAPTYRYYRGDGNIPDTILTIHALHIDTATAYLYLFGSNISNNANDNGYPLFISLADPWNPHYEGRFIVPSGDAYVHDGYVENDTAYFCHIYTPGFVSIVDVSNKSNPVEIALHISTPNQFPHNAWLSNDHRTLFTTDEVTNSFLTAYDISDFSNISELSRFQTDPGSNSIVHNTHIVAGDFAVTSWYTEGVVITDESRPWNPIEVGHYDTYPANNSGNFDGDWGVYPYLPSGNLVVSDMSSGLYVLGPNYVHACWLEGIVTDSLTGNPIFNASVVLSTTPNVTRSSSITGNYYSGTATAGTYTVTVTKGGYYPKTITGVSLTNGLLTTLDVQLAPIVAFSYNGSVVDSATGAPVANAMVEITSSTNTFNVTCDANGNFTVPLYDDTYTIIAGKWGYQTRCVTQLITSSSNAITVAIPQGYYDDFTFNFGWTVTGTSANAWERGEPVGTYNGSQVVNPEIDVNFDCEAKCYVTDNGGGAPGDNDVDNGNTVLTSPNFDLTIYSNPSIDYYRWFIDILGTGTPNDSMRVKLTNGTNTVTLETMLNNTTGNGTWVHKNYANLSSLLTLTSTMKLILEIRDAPSPGNVVEGGLDMFRVIGDISSGVNQPISSGGFLTAEGNPFYGSTAINYSLMNNKANRNELIVTDILGNIIQKYSLDNSTGKITVGQNLSSGVYFVSIVTGEGLGKTLKIVKAQ
jgi:choice-of-anchor B domain-containing protein